MGIPPPDTRQERARDVPPSWVSRPCEAAVKSRLQMNWGGDNDISKNERVHEVHYGPMALFFT
jgi:hypothetical protein